MNSTDPPSSEEHAAVGDRQAAARTAYLGTQAHDYDRKRFVELGGRLIAQAEQGRLEEMLGLLAPASRVLEVGCGTGRFVQRAGALGFDCTGADASPDMLAMARQKCADAGVSAHFELCEAARLPFRDGQFDAAYSIRLLNQTESVDYALQVIAEILRVVRPGGLVLIEFANAWRPHWGGRAVRLSPRAVRATGVAAGARLLRSDGLFLFGMTAILRAPRPLQPWIERLDRALGARLPTLCARGYALFEKRPADPTPPR